MVFQFCIQFWEVVLIGLLHVLNPLSDDNAILNCVGGLMLIFTPKFSLNILKFAKVVMVTCPTCIIL